MFLLVEFNTCYADEFDLNGYHLTDKFNSIDEYKARLLTAILNDYQIDEISGLEVYFGTNEWIDFEDENSILDSLQFKILTEEEYKIMSSKLPEFFGEFLFSRFFY